MSGAGDATEGVAVDSRQSVLIVDSSEETREVLQTALERRGLRILSADRARRGLELARRHHPDLIVLDLEVEDAGGDARDENPSAPFVEHSRSDHVGLVLLGSLRRGAPPVDGEFVAKPYHYGSLIRRIEELLVERRRGRGERAEGVFRVLLSRCRPFRTTESSITGTARESRAIAVRDTRE